MPTRYLKIQRILSYIYKSCNRMRISASTFINAKVPDDLKAIMPRYNLLAIVPDLPIWP